MNTIDILRVILPGLLGIASIYQAIETLVTEEDLRWT